VLARAQGRARRRSARAAHAQSQNKISFCLNRRHHLLVPPHHRRVPLHRSRRIALQHALLDQSPPSHPASSFPLLLTSRQNLTRVRMVVLKGKALDDDDDDEAGKNDVRGLRAGEQNTSAPQRVSSPKVFVAAPLRCGCGRKDALRQSEDSTSTKLARILVVMWKSAAGARTWSRGGSRAGDERRTTQEGRDGGREETRVRRARGKGENEEERK
jgi:hypothetical protein